VSLKTFSRERQKVENKLNLLFSVSVDFKLFSYLHEVLHNGISVVVSSTWIFMGENIAADTMSRNQYYHLLAGAQNETREKALTSH
jgi:hypothetical protein